MWGVGFAAFVGTEGTLWEFLSRGSSEGDEFDEYLGRGFKPWTGSDELEEHFLFLLGQKLDIFVCDAVGGQNVDQGFGWHDWFPFGIKVGFGMAGN